MTTLVCTLTAQNACGPADRYLNNPVPQSPTLSAADETLSLGRRCSTRIASHFPSGFSDHCIVIGKLQRNFRVYQPKKNFRSPNVQAAVLVLHGGAGSSAVASNPSESALGVFSQFADRENYMVVYPEGTADSKGQLGWNDCRADDTSRSEADDIAFLSELISELKALTGLTYSRFFMAGSSNGAMMSFRFAMEKSNLIGAIATSSGNIAKNPLKGRCQRGPERPVPVLMTHGTEDSFVKFEGGCVANLGRQCDRGFVESAETTVQFWLKANGVNFTKPKTSVTDTVAQDGGPAVERRYFGGRASVISWLLNGAGHPPPSKSINKGNMIVGKQNQDIEFAEASWAFFKSHL